MGVKTVMSSAWHAINNSILYQFGVSAVVVFSLCVGALLFLSSTCSSYGSDARLLVCSTSHTRFIPVRHAFTYPLLYVFLSIDKPGESAFFEVNEWKIF